MTIIPLSVLSIHEAINEIEKKTGKLIQDNKSLSGSHRLWVMGVLPNRYYLNMLSDYIAIKL